jgi:hypothetical protein
MQNITSAGELKTAIQQLEVEQAASEKLLKDQFYHAFESLKPANLIKGTIKDIATSPYLIDNLVGTAIGIATGYLSKKIFVRSSTSIARKLIGAALQFGVANAVTPTPGTVKSIGRFVLKRIHRKKRLDSKKV